MFQAYFNEKKYRNNAAWRCARRGHIRLCVYLFMLNQRRVTLFESIYLLA